MKLTRIDDMADAKSTSSYIPLTPIIGEKVGDDSYILHSKDIKNLNDTLYYMAKLIQGGLNLANLNAAANQVFTDIEGNVTELTVTAEGLSTRVSSAEGNITTAQQTANSASITASNALGEAQQVKLTVDGLSVADETGSYTIIDGDKLVSKEHATSTIVEIENGGIKLKVGTALQGEIYGTGSGIMISPSQHLMLGGMVQVGLGNEDVEINGYPIRLVTAGNISANALGTIYIGTNASYSGNVDIGQTGGTINLNGTVKVNGVPI